MTQYTHPQGVEHAGHERAGAFLERFARETKKAFVEITPDALERLSRYGWPGNVRELGNVLERAIVLGSPPRVTLEDLPPRVIAPESGFSRGTVPRV